VEAIRNAQWLRADLMTLSGSDRFDLAGAGYVLGELPPDTIAPLLATLWKATDGVCVVVEPGTPRGYGLTREAGEALEAAGARIIAPFPTSWPCLEHEKDWVHFAERVPRTRIHRLVKDASLSYEDEKFSYVAASRVEAGSMGARVVRQPQIRSGHVRLTLCTPQGVRHIVVGKSQRDAYRLARKLRWGSALNEEDASVLGLTDEAPSVSGRGS
jgi:ribosomal protein RSM22 (predicted rRNA methylase)